MADKTKLTAEQKAAKRLLELVEDINEIKRETIVLDETGLATQETLDDAVQQELDIRLEIEKIKFSSGQIRRKRI